jgi:hypothetical protein
VVPATGDIWISAAANALCGNLLATVPNLAFLGLPFFPPIETDELVCEFDQSQLAQENPAYGLGGDARAPRVYQYRVATSELIDRTPDDPGILLSLGIRAAGAKGNVVLMGSVDPTTDVGGGTGTFGSVRIHAFDATTGEYLGNQEFAEYNNVKTLKRIRGEVYMGVAVRTSVDPQNGGHLLRWAGDRSNPFAFEVVGVMRTQPTYIADFEGRMVASNWSAPQAFLAPGFQEPGGLWVSPPFGSDDRLTAADRDGWQKVWGQEEYDPDLLSARTLAGGEIVPAPDGWLYTGTITFPSLGLFSHWRVFPESQAADIIELIAQLVFTERKGTVFRYRNLGTPDQQVELLYGERFLTTWDPTANEYVLAPNLMGTRPLFGLSGFGNPQQQYAAWGGTLFQGNVYMGGNDFAKQTRDVTLNPDSGMMAHLGYDSPPEVLRIIQLMFPPITLGVDTWVFTEHDRPATPLTLNGFGNAMNNGNRDFFPIDKDTMLLGTNNFYNFPPTESLGGRRQRPGWELIEMTLPLRPKGAFCTADAQCDSGSCKNHKCKNK